MDEKIYEKLVDHLGYCGAHLEALTLIGQNKQVLDVGCGDGELGLTITRELGGLVDGIEINQGLADEAKKNIRKVYVGSATDMDIIKQIEEQYDVILFMDVLAYLKDPLNFLLRIKKQLKKDGYIIASIPNVSNWSLRLSLLFGKFDYQEGDLQKKNHFKLFTLKSTRELLAQADFKVDYLSFSFGEKRGTKSSFWLQLVKTMPVVFANKFIIKAVKA